MQSFFNTAEQNEELDAAIHRSVQIVTNVMNDYPSVISNCGGAAKHLCDAMGLDLEFVKNPLRSGMQHPFSRDSRVRILVPQINRDSFERAFFRRVKKTFMSKITLDHLPKTSVEELFRHPQYRRKISQLAQTCVDRQYLLRFPVATVDDLNELLVEGDHSFSSTTVSLGKHTRGGEALAARLDIRPVDTVIIAGSGSDSAVNTHGRGIRPSLLTRGIENPIKNPINSPEVTRYFTGPKGSFKVIFYFEPDKSFTVYHDLRLRESIISWVKALISAEFDFSFRRPRTKTGLYDTPEKDCEFDHEVNRWLYRNLYPSQRQGKKGDFIATSALLSHDLLLDL